MAESSIGPVHEALTDTEKSVSELLAEVSAAHVGQAWVSGDIEFGHRKYCTSGKLGTPESCLYVEEGFEWTGPKTPRHKRFSALMEEKSPKCGTYKKYVEYHDAETKEDGWKTITIKEEEALSLIGLQVRLTDAGLAKIGVAV